MELKVRDKLRAQGFADSQIETEAFLNLRYEGTDCSLMCKAEQGENKVFSKLEDFRNTFLKRQDFIDD
jgi:5-oxoprolinase (ATP-hydrolysing)